MRDAAGPSGHHRCPFPQRLGDDQAETLTNRFLDDHVRESLQRIDLDVAHSGEVGEDMDHRVGADLGLDAFVDPPTLRIVQRH